MTIAIIDYGSGNLRSAARAFERVVHEDGLKSRVLVTSDPEQVGAARHIVLPGVGAYGDCVSGLKSCKGLIEALENAVIRQGRPFLGICVGMQLMADAGREFGHHPGLGWIGGEVVALTPADRTLKIPHMGWNELSVTAAAHPVLTGLDRGTHAYFVHSYHFQAQSADTVLAETTYGGPVTAVIGRDNMVGTQFHPEKSQSAGLRLIHNFIHWKP